MFHFSCHLADSNWKQQIVVFLFVVRSCASWTRSVVSAVKPNPTKSHEAHTKCVLATESNHRNNGGIKWASGGMSSRFATALRVGRHLKVLPVSGLMEWLRKIPFRDGDVNPHFNAVSATYTDLAIS